MPGGRGAAPGRSRGPGAADGPRTAPPVGPGSSTWKIDQAALEAALEAGSPEIGPRIQDFFRTHQVLGSLG